MFYLWLYFMDVANLLLFLDALTSLSLSLSLLNCMSVLMILTIKIVEPEGKQMQLLLNVGGPDRYPGYKWLRLWRISEDTTRH